MHFISKHKSVPLQARLKVYERKHMSLSRAAFPDGKQIMKTLGTYGSVLEMASALWAKNGMSHV